MLFKRLALAAMAVCSIVAYAGVSVAGDAGSLSYRSDLSPKDRARVAAILAPPTDFTKPQPFEAMAGGSATSKEPIDRDAFSHSSANLTLEGEQNFKIGNALFRKLWVSAPSSTESSDGLGPLFNARACQRCHLKDGRGHPPTEPDAPAISMFLRLSVPPHTEAQRTALSNKDMLVIPEPTYGMQFQDLAVPGLKAEGRITIKYKEIPVALNGGETASLRAPTYGVTNLGYGPMEPDVMMSPRVAPQMIGLGLVGAIDPGDILAKADPNDKDGNGISGRPSMVRDPVTGKIVLGRFGWKASTPSILAQSASALGGDIGISNRLMRDPAGECTERETACRKMPNGVQPYIGPFEATDSILDLIVYYSRNLAVPVRRNVSDPQVLAGKQQFYRAGCSACHTPSYVTSRKAELLEHRFQLIWPYTDLLLHDMGEGLADHRPVGDASGTEWRTAPLWGIGLTKVVNGHTLYLHDGRARNLLEAILWHGGEAKASRNKVVAMTPDQRAALLKFVGSL